MKTQNAKKYHELSKPFENADVANKAIGDFFDELVALRDKYRIADLTVAVMVDVEYDGRVGQAFTTMELGDQLHHESMAARALGAYSAKKRALINQLAVDSHKEFLS